jgi:dienelactone hydrolase
VIVVQEIFGVHEHIRDLCRRLALEGYLAIAPELYFRQGDPNDYSDIPTLFTIWSAKSRTRRCWPISTMSPAGRRVTAATRIAAGHRFLLGRTH